MALSSRQFFFNDKASTEIYALSLHDALPISNANGLQDDGATGIVGATVTLIGRGEDGRTNVSIPSTSTSPTGPRGFLDLEVGNPLVQKQILHIPPSGPHLTLLDIVGTRHP